MNRVGLYTLIFWLLFNTGAHSDPLALDTATRKFLDEQTVAYYDEYASQASALGAIAQDTNKESSARVHALNTLSIKFPLLGLTVAKVLLNDQSEKVALEANQLLADSLVMSDHTSHREDHGRISERQKWLKSSNDLYKASLRKSLEDARPRVREIAAECMTQLSDEEGLEIIERAVTKGLYTEKQAVNYFGLAKPNVGGRKLEPYLTKSSSVDAQAAAVSYLGAYPQYQNKVRELLMQERSIPPSVKISAARTLSKYDKNYTAYAPQLFQDRTLPPDVFRSVMEGYLDQKELSGDVSMQEKAMLKKAVTEYSDFMPNANTKSLGTRIEKLR